MKVILNSDILFQRLVVERLSSEHQKLFTVCAKEGHPVVIPLTSLLEFKRDQSEKRLQEIENLNKAYELLSRHGVKFEQIESSELIKEPDIISIISNLGANVEVVEPTYEDFKEAHKRACLHEPPQLPNTKSDEMRDLVIWVVAVRLANQNGGALLISRDSVHVDSLGNDEAEKVGLERVKTIEEALEYFNVLTPGGELIKRLLDYVWDDLLEAGIPFSKPMSVVGVRKPRFKQGTLGPISANCVVKAKGSGGKVVNASVGIKLDRGIIEQISVSDVWIEKIQWNEGKEIIIHTKKVTDIWSDNYERRLKALKAVLGG